MMHELSPATYALRQGVLPSWVASIFVHLGLFVLLALTVQPGPRETAEETGRSTGIVLVCTSAEVELYELQDESGAVPAVEPALSVEIMPTLPNEVVIADVLGAAPWEPATRAVQATSRGRPKPAPLTPGSGGRRGSLSRGGEANVTVFGVQGSGTKFIYLFDRSSSMEGTPLAAAKRQLLKSLSSLQSMHQFRVMFFNTRTQAMEIAGGGGRIAFATDRNKQLAANFLSRITADGGTDRLSALHEAISLAPDVIFFLTDADDPMTPTELAEIHQANRQAQTAICTIEFGRRQSPSPDNFLVRLAGDSGGQYGYVNTTALRAQGAETWSVGERELQ
jgi:hypothetical protein